MFYSSHRHVFFISSEKVLRVVGRRLEEGVPVASPSPSEIGLRLSATGEEVLKAVEEALLEGVEDLHMKRGSFMKKSTGHKGTKFCTVCFATIAYKCCYFVNGKIKSPPQQQQQQQQQHRQFHDLVFATD